MKLCFAVFFLASCGCAATLDVGQPIPFSHKQHIDKARLGCSDCHKLAEFGEVYSIPSGKSCMACHTAIASDRAAIKDLASYVSDKEPVPWVRIFELPSFVNFSHKVHSDAGTRCEVCHGDVAHRDRLIRESDMSMGGCTSCHVQHAAKTGCHTCHDLDE